MLYVILSGVTFFSYRVDLYTSLYIVRLKHLKGYVILWVGELKEGCPVW
jgi:hypothetical protein